MIEHLQRQVSLPKIEIDLPQDREYFFSTPGKSMFKTTGFYIQFHIFINSYITILFTAIPLMCLTRLLSN